MTIKPTNAYKMHELTV